jgi:amidohydrolase
MEGVKILPEISAIKAEMIAHRRWFHQHPELSLEEYNTAAKVVEILTSYGITEIFEKVGKTGMSCLSSDRRYNNLISSASILDLHLHVGVVALIRGAQPGICIGLRADMDALPIQETADIEYKSRNNGVMHACGHDGHMASLLAAAKVLYNQRDKLKGVVKLIFQPAEEGYNGAGLMIDDGVLEEGAFGPRVDFIYGNHLWSCEYQLRI